MNEVVIDIVFVGLFIIPVLVNTFSTISELLISSYSKTLSKNKNKNYLLSFPASIFIIYDLLTKSNWAATIGLTVAISFFFYTYACAIAFLVKASVTTEK